MTRKESGKESSRPLLYWIKGWLYLTATLLALVGLFLLLTWWATRNSNDRWFGWRDPLLGIGNRAMLILGGALHLGAAAYLFSAKDLMNRSLVALWGGLNHLIYYMGIRVTDRFALPEAEHFVGWRLHLQPGEVDVGWKILQGWLILTSIVFLLVIWRYSKQLQKEIWFKRWLESRKQPKQEPAPLKRTEPEDYVKTACSHCGQKIAFPLSRAGESVNCPNCAAAITLREASAQQR